MLLKNCLMQKCCSLLLKQIQHPMTMKEMLYIILVDIPKDAIEYTWDTILKEDTWKSEELIASISRNAALLVQTLLDAVADIDQVSSRIPSFVSLNTIVDEVLQ